MNRRSFLSGLDSVAASALAAMMFTFLGSLAHANPVDQLKGAWVADSADCTKIFEKIGDQIKFRDRSASYSLDTGIIILKKDKVKGPIGGCTISTTAEENDRFSAQLQCTDGLVSRDFSMTFRIIDETHFERFDAQREYYHRMYTRCSL
jgi:hypothetical protein